MLFADGLFEEKSEEPQPDKNEKQYAYIEEEGNQGGASTSGMIAEDDVS